MSIHDYQLPMLCRIRVNIFSQANICTCVCGFVVCVVCVCPIIIKLGQMIEEGLCLRSVKDVNFNKHFSRAAK